MVRRFTVSPGRGRVKRTTRACAGAALVVSLLSGACGSAEVRQPTGEATEPAYASSLRPKLQEIFGDTLAPAAVVLVRSMELGDWAATFGTRTLGGAEPVTLADHVRIGSITKTWIGTVILQLVQEGRLGLGDPVSKYRADVPNGQGITIAQLLEMRSGLYNYSESVELNQRLDENPMKVWTPEELLAIAYKYPPYFAPGQGYHYSNTNTVLLGLIIESLTGNPLEDELQQRIFVPLGLHDTLLPSRTSSALPQPFPDGYQFGSNVETLTSDVLSPSRQAEARAGRLQPLAVTANNPSWAWAAGAGISTAGDLARYAEALVGGGLLNEVLQTERLASIRPISAGDPKSPGYGLALARFGPVYGHTGELPGYNSFMGHDPGRKITIVVWSSLNAAPDGRAPAVEMAKAIVADLYAELRP